jgi:hypothetical protein
VLKREVVDFHGNESALLFTSGDVSLAKAFGVR